MWTKKFLFTENVTCLDDMGIGVIKINGFTIWPYLVSNLHVYARVYLILLFYAPKSYYKEYRLKLVIISAETFFIVQKLM